MFESTVLSILREILTRLKRLEAREKSAMASFQDIQADVAAGKTAADSCLALIKGLGPGLGITQDALDQLDAAVKANNDEISAAIVAGTPVQTTQTTVSGAPPTV